ncbi:MAG: hypothetical protein ACXV5J_07900 [Candidatus Angelobacter sp.]
MAISDTTPEIEARQIRIIRSMTTEQRLLVALEMSLFSRELMKAGIRRDHPEWTEKEVRIEVLRRVFLPAPLPAWIR